MEITKILSLSYEEMDKLTEAGKILGSIRDTEFDEMNDETRELLSALQDVLSEINK